MKFILDYFREVEEALQPLTKYKLFLLGSLIASLDCMMYVIIISFIFILEYLFGDIGSKIAYGTIDILAVITFIALIRRCSKSLKRIIKKICNFLFSIDFFVMFYAAFVVVFLVVVVIQSIIDNL